MLPALLAPIAEVPERSAILLDVDGTLAPIVARPELAAIPDSTRAELRRLVRRYLLVACLSGRAGDDARRLVGVDGVRVVGNHGLELDPRARRFRPKIERLRDEVGLPVEDKGLSLTYHYREATNETAAVIELGDVLRRAQDAGLDARWGRKVLEVRPPIAVDKGTAVTELLIEAAATRALYAGDDLTDVDAFLGLATAREATVRIAVGSPEAPAELLDAADLVVSGPEALLELLRLL